jgi:hypothetical protein
MTPKEARHLSEEWGIVSHEFHCEYLAFVPLHSMIIMILYISSDIFDIDSCKFLEYSKSLIE